MADFKLNASQKLLIKAAIIDLQLASSATTQLGVAHALESALQRVEGLIGPFIPRAPETPEKKG